MPDANQPPEEPSQLDALVSQAVAHHQAGRLVEAAAAYRRILALRPDLIEMHNNLGLVLRNQGQLDEAIQRFEHALHLRPDCAAAHFNLGTTLKRQGKLDEAAARFELAMACRPGYAEAHYQLGNLQSERGQWDEAALRYLQALALRPDYPEAHNNLGNIYLQQNKLELAAAQFERAIALRPRYADAHYNQGNVLKQQNKPELAAACYVRALALRPNLAQAHINLGIVLRQQNRLDEAAAHYEQALALKPDSVEAHNNLGVILWQQERLDEAAARHRQALALDCTCAETYLNLGCVLAKQRKPDEAAAFFQQALLLKPDYPEAHNGLGCALGSHGRLDQAAASYRQAIVLRPDYAEALNNLGVALLDQGRLNEAAQVFERLQSVVPDSAPAQMGLASCYLVSGDFQRGWRAYEARLRLPDGQPQPPLPRWTGQALAGKSLLLVAEQGLGDTLQFVRYARLLKARGARIVLAVQPPLGRLFASHRDVDELFLLESADSWPRADFCLPLLSAAGALCTDASSIPCEIPYLWANPELIERWGEELAQVEGFKIGVAWQAANELRGYSWRSVPLADFAPLARLPGVQLVSLQKGLGVEQITSVDFPVLDLSDRLDEAAGAFMDTAAVIRNLDLVVTIDTSIGHLAGALGAPVFVALPLYNDWRWLLDRDDSPWYPTMRLFHQEVFGQWPDVFQRIAQAVEKLRSPASHREGQA